jgi:hypothetical protein
MKKLDLNSKSKLVHPLIKMIDAIEFKRDNRDYLGASIIGNSCSRAIQFEFFSTPMDKKRESRIIRIFHRGNEGEKWMAEWMKKAGISIDGKQTGFEALDGLFSGHCDGIITEGLENCPRIWENKVVGAKSWKAFEKNGLEKSNKTYYGQIQIYQAYLELENPALFTVLNADTMEIYAEDIEFNAKTAQELSDKALNIIEACKAGIMLPGVSEDPEYYECNWCGWKTRCYSI